MFRYKLFCAKKGEKLVSNFHPVRHHENNTVYEQIANQKFGETVLQMNFSFQLQKDMVGPSQMEK